VLEDRRYRGAPVVLLHQSWPYVREAAFLTQIYPHVYMDLSFAIPHLSLGEMIRSAQAALDAAPASKLMVATDTWGIPEHYFLGARRMRAVLGRVLGEQVAERVLRPEQAERLAELVMRGTACHLYGLTPVPGAPNTGDRAS
jgi:predicted TIM-barrel fold metal-dependent hydrolase